MKPLQLGRIACIAWALAAASALKAQTVRFPLPEVPDSITDPQARLGYAATRFWENFNFGDTARANLDVEEQGMADFIQLLSLADSATVGRAVETYTRKACGSPWGRSHTLALVDHYLGNTESPLRNDLVYAPMLRSLAKSWPADSAWHQRLLFRARQVAKNQVGSIAANFVFVDRDGHAGTLYGIHSPFTLIIFNDPDCEVCRRELPEAMAMPELQGDSLRVLMVYADADSGAWARTRHDIPRNWTDTRSPEGEIVAKGIYYLPATPSYYLLDRDKRVLLKDAPLQLVAHTAREITAGK